MSEAGKPWLTVVGLGEDGLAGLSDAARAAVNAAEVVWGGRRHLDLIGSVAAETHVWASPLADSLPALVACRPRRTVALASGDPFWHGLGTTLAGLVPAAEMRTIPAPSTFALMAARLRWPLETCATLALHAKPLALVRPHLRPGARLLVLLRDGDAPARLAAELNACGFGPSALTVMEALGGPRQRVRMTRADPFELDGIAPPVAVAVEARAAPGARIIPRVAGLDDDLFSHDGQLTKREIRATTLSALAPLGDELLWDVGAGSGSIGIEWLLAHPANRAIGIERRPDRLARARENAAALGVPHLDLRAGAAPDALAGLPAPDAVFFGGGAEAEGLRIAWEALKPGGRLVANAVTVDTEALLADCHVRFGGRLIRLSLARAAPVGGRIGWKAATARSILDAVAAACAAAGGLRPEAIATAAEKAAADALAEAAAALGAPVIAVEPAAFAAADALVETRSARVAAIKGVGSVCEAAALAALGPLARLAARRRVSPDGAAAAAVAVIDPDA